MKKRGLFFIFLLSLTPYSAKAYKILYAEQFYRLFHNHFYQYPQDINENIWYLEQALKSDFANPLNALARIETKKEWEKYRYLFNMHVNLKIIEQYRLLGSKYDKQVFYFYNTPWKEDNLKSLQIAEANYNKALYYWKEAKKWASKASGIWVNLEEIQNWEDESYRILSGDLNYQKIMERDLLRLDKVRSEFQK